jgi:hypothetical protein
MDRLPKVFEGRQGVRRLVVTTAMLSSAMRDRWQSYGCVKAVVSAIFFVRPETFKGPLRAVGACERLFRRRDGPEMSLISFEECATKSLWPQHWAETFSQIQENHR